MSSHVLFWHRMMTSTLNPSYYALIGSVAFPAATNNINRNILITEQIKDVGSDLEVWNQVGDGGLQKPSDLSHTE